jgi:hypothetical protein
MLSCRVGPFTCLTSNIRQIPTKFGTGGYQSNIISITAYKSTTFHRVYSNGPSSCDILAWRKMYISLKCFCNKKDFWYRKFHGDWIQLYLLGGPVMKTWNWFPDSWRCHLQGCILFSETAGRNPLYLLGGPVMKTWNWFPGSWRCHLQGCILFLETARRNPC